MFKAHLKTFFFCLFICFFVNSSVSYSAATDTSAEDDAAASSIAIASAISDAATQKVTTMPFLRTPFNDAIKSTMKELKTYFINEYTQRVEPYKQLMPFEAQINQLVNERVFSEFNASQVKIMMNNINSQALAGYKSVLNVDGSSSADNPMSKPNIIARNAKIAEKLNTVFCNPDSAIATAECKQKRQSAGIKSNENFIDFFLSERTWESKTVLDVMLMNRAFISSALTNVNLTKDRSSAVSFMDNQRALANDNLRLFIFDNLAARRAATSHGTKEALMTLLTILAPTGQVTSLNYQTICSKTAPTAVEKYVCSFTSDSVGGGERIISQAALDKIMQYDLMLSPIFYEQINSPGFTATGPIERLDVYEKAQQLAQDYRQLQLLQMKAVARAVNMMNK